MKRNNFRYIFKMVIKMCTRIIKNEENVKNVKIGLMTYFHRKHDWVSRDREMKRITGHYE